VRKLAAHTQCCADNCRAHGLPNLGDKATGCCVTWCCVLQRACNQTRCTKVESAARQFTKCVASPRGALVQLVVAARSPCSAGLQVQGLSSARLVKVLCPSMGQHAAHTRCYRVGVVTATYMAWMACLCAGIGVGMCALGACVGLCAYMLLDAMLYCELSSHQ
jgi:hypothetical protein